MSYNNIEVCKMTISDFNNIRNILLSDFDDFWNSDILKSELEDENSYYIIARIPITNTANIQTNSCYEIIGFAGLKIILDEADVMNIVTKKGKRNLGIGKLMLEKLIHIAKENGVKKITLEVNSKNTPAMHLYKKLNFEEISVRKQYYKNADDAIIMQLSIS